MALRRKMDHGIKIIFRKQTADQFSLTDIAPDENMSRVLREILRPSRIGQQVQIHDPNIRIGFQQVPYKMGSDEPGAAGDEVAYHIVSFP